MKILMIANFVTFPWEGGNSRFIYILNKLDCQKNRIELITSKFSHGKKEHRKNIEREISKLLYKVTLLDEPGYKKNVSLKRFYSHYKLGKNLKKYLKTLDYRPDVIYCSVPSLDFAKEATKFAKKNNIRLIVDIQDLWPESFKIIFNIPIISNLVFYPMKKTANYIYSNADNIIAVSDTYVNRALSVNKKTNKGLSVFLGTDIKYFDDCKKNNLVKNTDNLIRIVYIGTLGTSYDIISIIDAISLLNKKGINNIKFVVMGDGPLRLKFEEYAKKKNINCDFMGRLKYDKMVGVLCSCDIAVNPIVGRSVASIINKVGDYAAAGLPVLNTQNSVEYRKLLEKYGAGVNAINDDINDIACQLEKLIKDSKLSRKMGLQNRRFALEKFDRKKTYTDIIKSIKGE